MVIATSGANKFLCPMLGRRTSTNEHAGYSRGNGPRAFSENFKLIYYDGMSLSSSSQLNFFALLLLHHERQVPRPRGSSRHDSPWCTQRSPCLVPGIAVT
jgi:hypothetical protein